MQEHLRPLTLLAAMVFAVLTAGCGGSGDTSGGNADDGGAKAVALASDAISTLAAEDPSAEQAEATDSAHAADSTRAARVARQFTEDSIRMLAEVGDIAAATECPPAGPNASADSAAMEAAFIPLKVGLTLSSIWRAYDGDYDHECLKQVTAVDSRSVTVEASCPSGPKHKLFRWTRQLCRADLAKSRGYQTGGYITYPTTFRGALKFTLSAASFAQLKSTGKTPHHYIELQSRPDSLLVVNEDIDGVLESEGKGTFKLIVNNKVVEVPTIEATHRNDSKHELIRVKVLDDARVPFVLDYYHPGQTFFITYTKVSFPVARELERALAIEKRVDVYGIYFDFASDSLRVESEPILREIATTLIAHPEWTVTINGHTDGVGNAADNLDLSRRRSATVRRALVERLKVNGAQVTTNGFGASQPKETNDTPEGRARNRRVELVRR